MSNQIAGINIAPKLGADFHTQYNVPSDANLTQQTTLAQHPAYNMFQVLFNNTQTEKLGQHSGNDIFQKNGLVQNFQPQSGSKFNAIG